MATFGTHCLPQYPLSIAIKLPVRCSSLIDTPSYFLLSFASSVPASSDPSLRYVLLRHSVRVSPSRASGADNLGDRLTPRELNLAKRWSVPAGGLDQAAIAPTSISANDRAGRKLGTSRDVVNGKNEGSQGSRVSKKGLKSRDAGAKMCGEDKHSGQGEAAKERRVTISTSVEKGKLAIKGKKSNESSPVFDLRLQLNMCSKKGDVIGAMALYDIVLKKGIRLAQYHYNVLLYLCSSAAVGVIYPGKSGRSNSGSSISNLTDLVGSTESAAEDGPGNFNEHPDETGARLSEAEDGDQESIAIRVSEDVRNQALAKGFEIYERMCSQAIPMNEAALTSVARMAMATGNGDLAFETVKKIRDLGLTVRLRSYAPAIFSYCNNGEIDKAFEVERHMLDSGVQPEEPELAALLKVSVEAKKSDKVYYLLQKLRANVRQVSPSTAELIEKWFKSPTASKVGKRKWNSQHIAQAMENVGGGWHGLGWLGNGKWTVMHGNVDDKGVCLSCGEKLVAVDIDPLETENLAKSVASIAAKRGNGFNFQQFQKWLDCRGPFEAVIDAANVGLYCQRQFSITKVNVVANGMCQKLPSKKWPLIVVHNRRIDDKKINRLIDRNLLMMWRKENAIYPTPTGSNDDWYWLYAAVKCKCLIVTNDEMRDHNFQVLGNDFFPKWKERHQVKFTFKDNKPVFYMPPACSTVIQETDEGNWHVPISSEQELGTKRTWLCIRRNVHGSPHSSLEEGRSKYS